MKIVFIETNREDNDGDKIKLSLVNLGYRGPIIVC